MAASTTGGLLLCLLVLAAMATELPETSGMVDHEDDQSCSSGLLKEDQSCISVSLKELHGGSLLQKEALQSRSTDEIADESDDGSDENADFEGEALSAAPTRRRRRRRRKSELKPLVEKLDNLTKSFANAFGEFDKKLDSIEKNCTAAPTTATKTTTTTWKCGNLDASENSKCKNGVKWGHGNKKYNGHERWWTYANLALVSRVTWDDATLDDFQRVYFCDNRDGSKKSKCGLPPCSCTSPPCDVCPAKFQPSPPPRRG